MARLRLELQVVLRTPSSQGLFHGHLLECVPMFKSVLSIEQRLKSWIRAPALKVPTGKFVGLWQMGLNKAQGEFPPKKKDPLARDCQVDLVVFDIFREILLYIGATR